MRKIKGGAAAVSLLLTFAFVASAQAVTTNFTSSNVTAPADPSFLFQNLDTNPNATITVSGTTNWTNTDTSNLFDIGCYSGTTDYHDYAGPSNNGIALSSDGTFSVSVPQSFFASGTCHLVVVPHGTATSGVSLAGYTGPRVGFSEFTTSGAKTPNNALYDYYFDDVTTEASSGSNSIDDCGPYPYLVDGTSAMNLGNTIFNCASSFYTSKTDRINAGTDLPRSEIEVDGQNAYGSYGADALFSGSDTLPGFPALTVSVDTFDSSNGNAQTTESESLVKCTPVDTYVATSSTCTAFAPTGIALKRVTDYTDNGRVTTITDTYSSTDGQAHSLDLQYETDLNDSTAGWQFPGQTSFTTPSASTTVTDPGPSTAPGTLYAIDDVASAPSLTNVVGAATFASPYNSVTFDDTIWGPAYPSALFDYQRMVPAGGSTAITWSYATGTSLAEAQGYAAAAQAELRPVVTITSPANGATETSSPVTVTGTAGGGSGVQSVTVNGVSATISGGNWTATVPLTRGQNTLTATMTTNDGSTATASATVTYAPLLVSISSPADGATVTSSPLTVTGTAGGGSGVQSVTVNGVSATVSGGNWTATVPLTRGQNTLTATMTTDDGSTATASATVTYAPLLVSISSPADGATVTSSPLTVTGTAGGGSGVKSVTVNGVSATVSGGNWTATVPLTRGQNTLTATMTTDDGSTATASATVTYVPSPRVSVKRKSFNGKAIVVKLACAASGSACAGKITVRYTETVVRHHKKHRITLVVASKRYALGFGHTATFKAGLSRTGKRLLRAHHKLAAKGTVTVTQASGGQTTGATFKLTLKQPRKHRK